MIKISTIIILLFTQNVYANQCSRNRQLVLVLEKTFKKNCEKISNLEINKIKVLDLINKKIDTISSQDLEGFTSLEWLRLSKNAIKVLPDNLFSGAEHIRFLGLSDNQISNLNVGSFEYLKNLEKINLDNNLIKELPLNLFKNNLKLKVISIKNNKLKTIAIDGFVQLLDLSYFNLFGNKISKDNLELLIKKLPKVQVN